MTRQHDLNELRKAWKNASSFHRKLIERTANRISKESGEVKSMREALIKEHRQGNRENIKDIHDIVSKKLKYQN
jgi:accessory colonization factor AcfC